MLAKAKVKLGKDLSVIADAERLRGSVQKVSKWTLAALPANMVH